MEKKLELSQEIFQDISKIDEVLLKGTEIIENEQIKKAVQIILKSGGKRLRPILILACGLVGKYQLKKLIPAGVAIELLHIASLIHDDILDGALKRRGSPTANSVIGEEAAISAGDFLFAKTFEILSDLQNNEIIQVIGASSNALSIGELSEIEMSGRTDQSDMNYLNIIRNKTASLFSASCKIGAILAEASEADIKTLGIYGDSLGIAFQIYDDVLDLVGKEEEMGKPSGIDLREGKVTLPIIYALDESNFNKAITEVIEKKRTDEGSINAAIKMIVGRTSAIEKAKKEAERYVNLAIKTVSGLKNEQAKNNLINIGKFVTLRVS